LRTNYLAKSFLLAGLILSPAMGAGVVNGGFEDTFGPINPGGILYSANPWNISDPNIASESATGVCLASSCGSPFGPHSGNAYFFGGAWRGSTGNDRPSTVYQGVVAASGTTYTLSFWLAQPAAGAFNYWAVVWDNGLIAGGFNEPVFGYTQYTFTVTARVSPDVLEFFFYDNAPPGTLAGYELDDVSLDRLVAVGTSTSAIPEPGSGLLVAMVFVLAGLVGVFKKKILMLSSPRVREDS
jgi:hypothetical protein